MSNLQRDLGKYEKYLVSNLQRDLEKRKSGYLEAVVRRDSFLGFPGWDSKWNNSIHENVLRKAAATNTVCEANNYQIPERFTRIYDKLLKFKIFPVDANDEANDIFKGLARLELIKKDSKRQLELFGEAFPDTYWEKMTQESIFHMTYLKDTADFHANYLLRLVYLYGDTPRHLREKAPPWRQRIDPEGVIETEDQRDRRLSRNNNFSANIIDEIRDKFIGFKFWLDEPFHAEIDEHPPSPSDLPNSLPTFSNKKLAEARKEAKIDETQEEMVYWSENHQILFATAEFLAGQMWPDVLFQAGKEYRDEYSRNPQIQSYTEDHSLPLREGDISGKEHMRKVKPRLLRWLNDRLRFGFSEWNSPTYYEEDFIALFNLADFCLDADIQTRACMVLDLLIFDLARYTNGGSFGVTAGRAYADNKTCAFNQSTGNFIEILFGTRKGIFSGVSAVALSFISQYGLQSPRCTSCHWTRSASTVDRSFPSFSGF